MEAIPFSDIKSLIDMALHEDRRSGDVTSRAIFQKNDVSRSYIRSKDSGVFCGSFLAEYVYRAVDPAVKVVVHVGEGETVSAGDTVLTFTGPTISILEGERILLNFLQRMCGIASRTAEIVKLVEGGTIRILDTRKTLPGFRLLDKYAVAAGGGTNHRMGLFDMVMIKDNHIKAAGSIKGAVEAVRKKYNTTYKVEVETTTLDEVKEALSAGADIIMLDNMDRPMIEQALGIIKGATEVELSGNMDEKKIGALKDLAVDYISIGGLTHSVSAFDLSMKFE